MNSSDEDTADTLSFTLLGSGLGDFVLDSSTGVVTLSRALEYELTFSYFLSIIVFDDSGGSASSNLNVTVNDINESSIFLSTPFSVSTAENLQTGVNVMRVKASDEDSGDSLTYSLSGTNSSHFAISSSTGLVTTAQLLDKETVGSYSLNALLTVLHLLLNRCQSQ